MTVPGGTGQVEHADSVQPQLREPIEALIVLARELGAASVVADARRLTERLDAARVRIGLLGPPTPSFEAVIERLVLEPVPVLAELASRVPISIRHGRVAAQARLVRGDREWLRVPLAQLRNVGGFADRLARVEIVADAPILERGIHVAIDARPERPSVPGASLTLTAAEAITDELLTRIARESGAARVEPLRLQAHRHLFVRLQHHVAEHHRALALPEHQMIARIDALAVARIVGKSAIEERRAAGDRDREQLEDLLIVERKKFVMSNRADALIALADELAGGPRSPHELRRTGEEAAPRLAALEVARFRARVRPHLDRALADVRQQLMRDLRDALSGRSEMALPLMLASFELPVIQAAPEPAHEPTNPSVLVQLADRMRLASRRRIASAAQDVLIETLDRGTRMAVRQLLLDFEAYRAAIEMRFCELVSSAIDTSRQATQFARWAQLDGAAGYGRARERVTEWNERLRVLARRLD